jgi:sugar-specific transcriptional regulator TrmB
MKNLAYKKIVNVLTSFGLTNEDAQLYIQLAAVGPQNLPSIQNMTQLPLEQLSISLKKLEEKGLVQSVVNSQEIFKPVSFQEALVILVKSNLNEALEIEKKRDHMIKLWQASIATY